MTHSLSVDRAACVAAWLALALLVPGAEAAPVAGLLLVEGAILLPPAQGAAVPLGFYMENEDVPLDVGQFSLFSPETRLRFEQNNFTGVNFESYGVPAAFARTGHYEWETTLHNATITLADRGLGFLSLEDVNLDARMDIRATSPSRLESAASTHWEYYSTTGAGENAFAQQIDRPHLRLASAGEIKYQGGGQLKIFGPTLHILAEEGEFEIQTGDWDDERSSSLTYRTLVALQAAEMDIILATGAPWALAAAEAETSWKGEVILEDARLPLTTSEPGRPPTDRLVLSGAYRGVFQPQLEDRNVLTALQIEAQDAGAPSGIFAGGSGRDFFLVGLALGAVLAAGGGSVWVWRRREARSTTAAAPADAVPAAVLGMSPDVAAEYYVGLAEQALQFDDHARALHWITLARQAAPTSASVATTMAYVLGEMGHFEEALAAYADAAALDPSDGEADLNAARLAAQAARDPEEIEALVLRALERSPEFVVDVEEDPEFRPLAERPTFRRGVHRAWERWSGEERPVR